MIIIICLPTHKLPSPKSLRLLRASCWQSLGPGCQADCNPVLCPRDPGPGTHLLDYGDTLPTSPCVPSTMKESEHFNSSALTPDRTLSKSSVPPITGNQLSRHLFNPGPVHWPNGIAAMIGLLSARCFATSNRLERTCTRRADIRSTHETSPGHIPTCGRRCRLGHLP